MRNLAIAGVVVIVSAVVHVIHGERYVLRVSLAERMEAAQLVRLAWHAMALLQVALGAALLVISRAPQPQQGVIRAIALCYLGVAVLGAALTRGRHPVWAFYTGLAVLIWFPW